MTKTDARLALAQKQRRFEWELAREEQTRTASKLVAGKTHDLLNLVQIVQLASAELGKHCSDAGKEFVADLTRAATDAQATLLSLMQVARPDAVRVRGPAVGAIVTRVLEEIRTAVEVDLHLAVSADTATSLTAEQLEHLVIGIALDAADAARIELYVRDRTIDGKGWVEIVRGAETPRGGDSFDLRSVELLAKLGGGELARSERRGGGTELVVALPAL
ncbi:MAG: HAMP domain-containing histidine kinase [Deltaproteobacteria bacterium]|nr:HAMP domain-containing histidine kinase [Deltaproteobacteria bacterium]